MPNPGVYVKLCLSLRYASKARHLPLVDNLSYMTMPFLQEAGGVREQDRLSFSVLKVMILTWDVGDTLSS